MKTYSLKPTDVDRKWYVIDASEAPLGRIATRTAKLLLGKDKTSYDHHTDGGDYVVIINAAKLVVTGDKATQKQYHRHSGYPGALRTERLEEKMVKSPSSVIHQAVRGMLPVNKLRPGRLNRLKIYDTEEHQHAPQKPIILSMKESK
jgi:large subunit ribosomal protein L13